MKFSSFRSITVIALTALLTACGAGQQDSMAPMQLASVHSDVIPAPAATVVSAPAAATVPAVAAVGPNMPAPDCAAEGCARLRIIDGNAEAFRIDAMRRAAAENS
ncbi:hypothetical protein [Massilia consociata]|uniref:Uncharacterized protein n=1 Tax=Massilia consociata TaxID=760117 RepID=A0ABV6FBG5_9BURK